ncbi:MAG: S-methyl-5'-thioadenosine phosphorylase [SAR202 cluster bacterium]|nr:S-methyl-5'-thioadenosine phosphorylase [SAR202 cluster bacterium]
MSTSGTAGVRVGVIGGSGLYQMEGLTAIREARPTTPFGEPSDVITIGAIDGVEVAFLPRHGRGHRLNPTEIPVKANIHALKQLGVEWLISVSAVGSLQEAIAPLHMVVPDQLIDRTRLRDNTFFGDGLVAHIGFAEPFCADLSRQLTDAARLAGATVHAGGTYVVMEGPAFSTKAESSLYRGWGASVIGMTALPEARLAREAEMCYAMLACATDYDVWHDSQESVSVELVLNNLRQNVSTSQRALRHLIPRLRGEQRCEHSRALATALVTQPDLVPDETKRKLAPLLRHYPAYAPKA